MNSKNTAVLLVGHGGWPSDCPEELDRSAFVLAGLLFESVLAFALYTPKALAPMS